MIYQDIKIKVNHTEKEAVLTTYLWSNYECIEPSRVRPIVVICPGGGYEYTSDREAEAIALTFVGYGYHAAVLQYSTKDTRFPTALMELASAVKFLREKREEYHIDSNRIIIAGFSAGGHLAASLGVFWSKEWLCNEMKVIPKMIKPNGLILCYPVITSGKYAHRASFERLTGANEGLLELVSLEKQVTSQVPNTFLWHTVTDDCVPVENSILFFNALKEKNVPVELHIYPAGGHGLSLATKETQHRDGGGIQRECQSWTKLAHQWIELQVL